MTSAKSATKPVKQSTRSKQSASKTSKPLKKKSTVSSTKRTPLAKKKDYRLDKYTMSFEWTKRPVNSIFVSLKDRIKLAWKVLRDES